MIDKEAEEKANVVNTKIYNAYKGVADKTVWKKEEMTYSSTAEAYKKMKEKENEKV